MRSLSKYTNRGNEILANDFKILLTGNGNLIAKIIGFPLENFHGPGRK
jgi:hypothetical protein